jgi:hypothetical protein
MRYYSQGFEENDPEYAVHIGLVQLVDNPAEEFASRRVVGNRSGTSKNTKDTWKSLHNLMAYMSDLSSVDEQSSVVELLSVVDLPSVVKL